MWLRSLLISLLAMSLSACASIEALQAPGGQAQVYPPAAFTHRVATTHVILYWNCDRPEPGVLRLDGVVHSPYFSDVRSVELDLVGVNGQDRGVSEASGSVRDFILQRNQISPFQLSLRLAGSEARFDLFYRYRSQEHIRTAASRPTAAPQLLAQSATQFLVRDACSETQHRIR